MTHISTQKSTEFVDTQLTHANNLASTALAEFRAHYNDSTTQCKLSIWEATESGDAESDKKLATRKLNIVITVTSEE